MGNTVINWEMGLPLRTYYKKNAYNGKTSFAGPELIKKDGKNIINTYFYKRYGERQIYK